MNADRSLTVAALTVTTILSAALVSACAPPQGDAGRVRRIIGRTGLGLGEFSYPRALAVSPEDGCIFVVDKTARIQRFSLDGEYEHQWRMPEYAAGKPTGLTIDRDGRVWVADTHYSRVIVYDRDGRELFRFGENGEGPGQFIFPTSIGIDAAGNVYVGEFGGNDRISKFSPQREYQFSFATVNDGEAHVERPTELVFDGDGVLWVADCSNHRICRFTPEGRLLSTFGMPGSAPDELSFPYGLTFEPSGTILVADRGNNRIVRYDPGGRMLGTWGTTGRASGQLTQPWDVAIGRDGSVLALDSWNNRIQVLDW